VSGALVLLGMAAATLTAVAGLASAASARETLRTLHAERRRERWARLEAAAGEVHRAALAYARAMERGPARAIDAERAAERYGDACERLSAELSAGPAPADAGDHLPILLDPSRPERVARSRAAELVLAELSRVRAAEAAPPARPSRLDALRADLARLHSGLRLARLGLLGRPGPPAAG
jgi:hypothetical protein